MWGLWGIVKGCGRVWVLECVGFVGGRGFPHHMFCPCTAPLCTAQATACSPCSQPHCHPRSTAPTTTHNPGIAPPPAGPWGVPGRSTQSPQQRVALGNPGDCTWQQELAWLDMLVGVFEPDQAHEAYTALQAGNTCSPRHSATAVCCQGLCCPSQEHPRGPSLAAAAGSRG